MITENYKKEKDEDKVLSVILRSRGVDQIYRIQQAIAATGKY